MSTNFIEHSGIVQAIANGQASVAIETSGCKSCGQGSACGISRLAGDTSHVAILTLEAPPHLRVGELVQVRLPESRITLGALFGYLFPAIALLVGAGFGAALEGSDGGTALGAMAGFLAALALARIGASALPGLLPAPELVPLTPPSYPESHHDY